MMRGPNGAHNVRYFMFASTFGNVELPDSNTYTCSWPGMGWGRGAKGCPAALNQAAFHPLGGGGQVADLGPAHSAAGATRSQEAPLDALRVQAVGPRGVGLLGPGPCFFGPRYRHAAVTFAKERLQKR